MSSPPDPPPIARGAKGWVLLTIVWLAGLMVWSLYLAAFAFVFARVFFREVDP